MINNCMELMVVICVIEVFKCLVSGKVYIDLQYVLKGISEWIYGWKCNGWKIVDKKLVKNVDLW